MLTSLVKLYFWFVYGFAIIFQFNTHRRGSKAQAWYCMFCNAKLWAINQGYVFINYAYFSLLLGLMKYPRKTQLYISFFFSNLSQISIKCVIDRHNRIRSNQTSFYCWDIPCFILVESVKIDMIFLDSKQLQQMLMVIICKSSKHKWKIEWLLIYFDIILEKKKTSNCTKAYQRFTMPKIE